MFKNILAVVLLKYTVSFLVHGRHSDLKVSPPLSTSINPFSKNLKLASNEGSVSYGKRLITFSTSKETFT